MATLKTHATSGKIKSSAPGSRTNSSGLKAKSRPSVLDYALRTKR